MAAFPKVPKFTVEEVLARVVVDVEDKTKEVPVRSVDEVIKSSTDQLSCLRESIHNYYDFMHLSMSVGRGGSPGKPRDLI